METIESKRGFGAVDFVVFVGMLLLSMVIGLYYAYKDRNNKSVDNYYFAERKMSPIPVGLSIAVSFVSSITVLGTPSHSYVHGSVIIWLGFCLLVQTIVACVYYIPLFQRLQLSSIYEYLELRYHKSIRLLASAITTLNMVFYMGTNIYLTGLALNAATPMGMNASILLTAGICTFYTTVGGMKAVIWNDAFQSVIMVAGTFAVLIRTVILVGGVGNVWEAMERGQRNNFWTFDLDPRTTHTVWTIMVGNGVTWISIMCSNQAVTQRYQSCSSVKTARQAAIISAVPMCLLIGAAAMSGCAMYAYFEGCDPLKSGKVSNLDQTVVLLVMDIFKDTPGVPGLFVSAAYSGMLSTVSSGINSVGALILEDFIIPARPKMKQSWQVPLSKLLSVMLGITVTGMAFSTEYFGKTVIQIVIGFFGTFGGPVLGAFICGVHFPWTNSKGMMSGLVIGLIISVWVSLGGVFTTSLERSHVLPLSDELCPTSFKSSNASWATTESEQLATVTEHPERSSLQNSLYSLSYLYYGCVGMAVVIVVAFLVSFITGRNDPKKMNPKLFIPLMDNKHLPECVRSFFRFGVPKYEKDNNCKVSDEDEKANSAAILSRSHPDRKKKNYKIEGSKCGGELEETFI